MNLLKAFLTYAFLLGLFGTVLGVIGYTIRITEEQLTEYLYFPSVLQIAQLTFSGIVVGSIIFLAVGIIMQNREAQL